MLVAARLLLLIVLGSEGGESFPLADDQRVTFVCSFRGGTVSWARGLPASSTRGSRSVGGLQIVWVDLDDRVGGVEIVAQLLEPVGVEVPVRACEVPINLQQCVVIGGLGVGA